MQLFTYVALDKGGNEQYGSLEAEDKRDVNVRLRQIGLYAIEVKHDLDNLPNDVKENELIKLFNQITVISTTKKIFFFRQLSLMLTAGLALTESLDMVKAIVGGKLAIVVGKMSEHVKKGGTFSNAISQADIFPGMAEHMIRSAEATGELDVVMGRIGDDMHRKADMKRQMTAAMLYPGITMFIAVLMGYFMVTSVIPKFVKIFENTGKKLPAETQRLVDISHFFVTYGNYILVGLIVTILLLKYARGTQKGKYITDRIILGIPIIGKVVRVGAMSQIGWGLSTLLRSGLTLVEALKIIEKLMPNAVIALEIHRARNSVLTGRDLGSSLNSPFIDPLIYQLASVGERTGGLVAIMHEAGNFYEESLKSLSKTLANLVEPASILVIGGMVMMVYIGFFKAMMGASG